MEQCPALYLGIVAIRNGVFGSPSTKVANFDYLLHFYRIALVLSNPQRFMCH